MKRYILVALVVLFALSATAFAIMPVQHSTAAVSGETVIAARTFHIGESILPPGECPPSDPAGCGGG